jgi:hypothetical protein
MEPSRFALSQQDASDHHKAPEHSSESPSQIEYDRNKGKELQK